MEGRDSMSAVDLPAVRDELVATLEEALRLQQQLVADAGNDGVPVADLVAQVTVLERLDDRRDDLISQLRRTASAGIRAAKPGPPIREVVLETLTDLRWPQNAGFLEEYLWARRQLQLDSRAFAPLRRDERRAWQRSPGARDAYIVPALNPEGTANPRWITSSAWPLERRIIASPQTERLLDLQKIYSLAGRPGSADADARGPRGPVDALLGQYAEQILGTEPLPVSASGEETSAWRAQVREHASNLIGEIRRKRRATPQANRPPARQPPRRRPRLGARQPPHHRGAQEEAHPMTSVRRSALPRVPHAFAGQSRPQAKSCVPGPGRAGCHARLRAPGRTFP